MSRSENDMRFHARPPIRKDFGSAFGLEGYDRYPAPKRARPDLYETSYQPADRSGNQGADYLDTNHYGQPYSRESSDDGNRPLMQDASRTMDGGSAVEMGPPGRGSNEMSGRREISGPKPLHGQR